MRLRPWGSPLLHCPSRSDAVQLPLESQPAPWPAEGSAPVRWRMAPGMGVTAPLSGQVFRDGMEESRPRLCPCRPLLHFLPLRFCAFASAQASTTSLRWSATSGTRQAIPQGAASARRSKARTRRTDESRFRGEVLTQADMLVLVNGTIK